MSQPYIIYDSQIFDQQKFGGISRYFCEIISHLSLRYDITTRYTENHYLTHSKLGKHRIDIPHFIFKHYESNFYNKNWRLAKKMLQTSEPYLYHPTYYDTSLLKYIGQNPYVITVHDMTYEKYPDLFIAAETIIQRKREIITGANRIIAISESTKKDITNILQIDPSRIDVIYHGTSMQPPNQKYKLNLPNQYVLFIGAREHYKNFARLLQAFSLVSQAHKELFLICTGQPFSKEELVQINQLHLNNRIIQMPIDDRFLNELYARALLFIFPSWYEGFGIPILEAYACQCPVVLSKTSCFPEIAGNAGFYFDPHSTESIADAINDTIESNQEVRQELILAGKERLKMFSWQKATQETENIYRKVMNESIGKAL